MRGTAGETMTPDEIEELEGQLHRIAPPLHIRALFVVILVTMLPLGFAWGTSLFGETNDDVAEQEVLRQARGLADLVEGDVATMGDGSTGHALPDGMSVRADNADARITLLSSDGRALDDVGHGHRLNWVERAQDLLFGIESPKKDGLFDSHYGSVPERDLFELAQARGSDSECKPSSDGRQRLCQAIVALESDGGRMGFLLVERAERRAVRTLSERRYQLLRLTLTVLPVSLLLGLWLGWRMIRPIEVLGREVRHRAKLARPTPDLPVTRRDEFGELSAAFNLLIARLQERGHEQEAFVADLVHEFKNPVAAIRSAADKLAEGGHDAARLQRLSKVLQSSSVSLDQMLTEFMSLASAEAGLVGENVATVDIAELARNLGADDTLRERRGDVELEVQAPEPALASVVSGRVEIALRNLLANALDFAATRVVVKVEPRGADVCILVSDDGAGISEEDAPHVFERFFTRRKGGGGSGLGLALARAVAEAHRGNLMLVEPSAGAQSGATFELRLPAAGSPSH